MYAVLIATLILFFQHFSIFLGTCITFRKYLKVNPKRFFLVFIISSIILLGILFISIYYTTYNPFILITLKFFILITFIILRIIFIKIPFFKQLYSIGFALNISLLTYSCSNYITNFLRVQNNTIYELIICILAFLLIGIPLEILYYKSFNNPFDNMFPKLYSVIWFFPFLFIFIFLIAMLNTNFSFFLCRLPLMDFLLYSIMLLLGIFCLYLLSKQIFLITLENLELSTCIMYNKVYENNFFYLQNKMNQVNALKNEGRSILNNIRSLCEANKYQEVNDYINKLFYHYDNFNEITYTKDPIISSILCDRLSLAEKYNITIGYEVDNTSELNLGNDDLYSLVMNILDYSINTCKKSAKESSPYILFSLHKKDNFLFISCENSNINNISNSNKRNFYTKDDEYEYNLGINLVKDIVHKYNGFIDVDLKSNKFIIKCYLNLDYIKV